MFTQEPDYAVPPGSYLEEWLDDHQMSQAELARRLGVSGKHVSKLIGGASLSPSVANGVALVTGVPAATWLTWEALYRADMARLSELESVVPSKDVLARFPLSTLRKHNYVTATLRRPALVARELCAFFRVANFSVLTELAERQLALPRQQVVLRPQTYAMATWVRLCELQAEASWGGGSPYSKQALELAVPQIRALSREFLSGPDDAQERLVSLLASAGVQLIFEPGVDGARAYGGTFWHEGRPVIGLTLRGKDDGQFWFTLFHEIGHVLKHNKSVAHINEVASRSDNAAEIEADSYAQEVLIPSSYAVELPKLKSKEQVRALASEIGVSPGVVVGRLWHDQLWPHTHGHDLTLQFSFVTEKSR
ncbi:ImmA/IrrE family metallo-endopeptidase [Pseudoclavibacter sp. CFCC 13611]|uniref:ImmA/IrrE family metallo-endopeptidase n=1 Tax=Pseudoclavibacter sp. CFCC 13611 TaxID=2615178 RepID=UPI00130184FA|nr:ImmA/IrrE family metallo-endopeptidase [Pseudoclavibacter sp. CFCC 13611]KAB1662769.1 ImmA/IrrE family metallo-endopeptidase [Pseudoclavibacter sp. CFCC 13611]